MIVCSSGPVTVAVGTQHHDCHLTAAGARCRGGGQNPGAAVDRFSGLAGTRRRGAAGRRGGDVVDGASGCCLTSVTPVCRQLISFPTALLPLGFVAGFYFLFLFLFSYFSPSRTRAAHSQRHTQLFPLRPGSPMCPSHELGCPPRPRSPWPVGAAPRFWRPSCPPKTCREADTGEWCGFLPGQRFGKPRLPSPTRERLILPPPKTSSPAACGPVCGFLGTGVRALQRPSRNLAADGDEAVLDSAQRGRRGSRVPSSR